MRAPRCNYVSFQGWQNTLPYGLMFLIVACSPVSHAQTITASSAVTALFSFAKASTAMSEGTSATLISSSFESTLPASTLASNSTSSAMSLPTRDAPDDIFDTATSPDGHPIDNGSVFNYYFLFLILFGLLVAGLLWWLRWQRQRRKEQMRLSGQHALARDLEGWPGTRQFMHGRYGRYHTATRLRRDEGLDEHGEAPPPYQPKNEATVATIPAAAGEDRTFGVTIPLRTLPRNSTGQTRPPAYSNTHNGEPGLNSPAVSLNR